MTSHKDGGNARSPIPRRKKKVGRKRSDGKLGGAKEDESSKFGTGGKSKMVLGRPQGIEELREAGKWREKTWDGKRGPEMWVLNAGQDGGDAAEGVNQIFLSSL